jgi:DNA-binding CsgD family transcriptional regulator
MRRRDLDELTAREREVLALLRRDFTNEQIADRLGISLDGAKYHVSQILSKLGVATREDAAAWRAEEHPWWWAQWPAWAKIGLGAGSVAVAAGVLGVIAMTWDVSSGVVEDDLPDVAKAESRAGTSRPTSPRPSSPARASQSATPLPSPVATPSDPSVNADVSYELSSARQSVAATPLGDATDTPTPVSTPACPGPDYQGQLPWNCVDQGDCSRQVTASVSLDKSIYKIGEPISLTLDAVNDSPDSIVLCYADGQQFELFVQSAGNTVTFYSREELVPYTQMVWNEQVPAGWNQTRIWNWDQNVGAPYEQGSALTPGAYEIRGVWTANGCNGSTPDCPNASARVQFVVEP